MSSDKIEITLSTVKNLVTEQFPQWADLSIWPVEFSGLDNRTFRLGETMSIRLPSAECYAAKVPKEQHWLPILSPQLSCRIPEPLVQGQPNNDYPWNWSIYKWIEGDSANCIHIDDADMKKLALQLANFLNELHKVQPTADLLPGPHNFWRGAHPSVYGEETMALIADLQDVIDTEGALLVWKRAIGSQWNQPFVWIHGDFASGNILVKNGELAGVIDFGGMGVGDPACDLVIAWTFLKGESREIFRSQLNLDVDTWARARGWALWKACYELGLLKDKESIEAMKHRCIINEVILEHERLSSEL